MSDNDAVTERLDRIAVILELGLKPQLDAARSQLRADKTDAAIFDLTARKWVAAGDLQDKVQARTKTGDRTVQRHISNLIDTGHLEKRGATTSLEYRSSGLI